MPCGDMHQSVTDALVHYVLQIFRQHAITCLQCPVHAIIIITHGIVRFSCICEFVCLCVTVHALKEKWHELSTPKSVELLSMAGSNPALMMLRSEVKG